MSKRLVIAIDGPSGSGKSSVARAVARALELDYLDTGAMYRAVTWFIQDKGVNVTDPQAIAENLSGLSITPSINPDVERILVGETDVTTIIREQDVTSGVSYVSAVPEVRLLLVQLQREVVKASSQGAVVEGRDIGSVVLPDADLKVFLTADELARAQRRAAQVAEDVEKTKAQLLHRDHADSTRAVSPFTQNDGAIVVDTTHMELTEVVEHILQLVAEQA